MLYLGNTACCGHSECDLMIRIDQLEGLGPKSIYPSPDHTKDTQHIFPLQSCKICIFQILAIYRSVNLNP